MNALKIARISYNSSEWQRPTGEARDHEQRDTYNYEHGFGHEDWLFRSDWRIDGWRYAFIQGVNKSHAPLLREGRPFDLTLWTLLPDKRRRYIATIKDVECLDDEQAGQALRAFEKMGWLATMYDEIRAVGGNEAALGDAGWTAQVLNIRYRLDNLSFFAADAFASPDDPLMGLKRYSLCDDANIGVAAFARVATSHPGSADLPDPKSFMRRAVASVMCNPEHARMQAKLMLELHSEFPGAQVVREQAFIDVVLRTDAELLLFEIKSDLEPRTVIRQALGQILEYGFHPSRRHELPVRLFIVGRNPLTNDDQEYLVRLQREFGLSIGYRVVSIQ